MTDLSQAIWRKSTLSAHNGGCVEVTANWQKASASVPDGNCVEIAALHGNVGVRDSQAPGAGAHIVSQASFAAFLSDARSGRFDI